MVLSCMNGNPFVLLTMRKVVALSKMVHHWTPHKMVLRSAAMQRGCTHNCTVVTRLCCHERDLVAKRCPIPFYAVATKFLKEKTSIGLEYPQRWASV